MISLTFVYKAALEGKPYRLAECAYLALYLDRPS